MLRIKEVEHKEHIEFNWRFYLFTKEFLETGNIEKYVQNLRMIEEMIRRKYNYSILKSMWFRLYEDDTLVTDINSIEADFNNAVNRETLITDLRDAVKNASVRIYFS